MDVEQPREVGWGRRSPAGRAVVVALALAAVVLGAWLATVNLQPVISCEFATSRPTLPPADGARGGTPACPASDDSGWLLTAGVVLVLAGLAAAAAAVSSRPRVPAQ